MGDATGGDAVTRLMSARDAPEPVEIRQALAEVEGELFGKSTDPVTLARFILLERLGVGGAGVVYAAYDPELDRKVAIKLLHPSTGRSPDTDETEARARLLREAQAIARMSHPNVVTVYDVGTYEEDEIRLSRDPSQLPSRGVFVVMEYIEGVDIARWLDERQRSWREILEMFTAAGRGLAAAHDRGIVHRDFKPANVLVATDGRVRVLDFGLARAVATDTVPPEPSSEDALDSPLTVEGTIMGTPPYMAPEQHHGLATDARTDQYSFCVALYEALYGRRPFAGRTIDELRTAKDRGDLGAPPSSSAVPAWVFRVVHRGLAVDPDARFPSMTALLAALARDPARRRRRLFGAGAGLLIAGAIGVLGAQQYDRNLAACAGHARRLDGIWDPHVHEQIAAAFRTTGKPYAEATLATVADALDRYAETWTSQRTEACAATVMRGEQAPEVMERRVLCLDRRLQALEQLTELYRDHATHVIEHAVEAAAGLPAIASCMDPDVVQHDDVPLDPALRAAVADVDRDIARATAELDAENYAAGLARARAAVDRAREIGHPPTEARALLLLGRLQTQVIDGRGAEQSLFDAFLAAERSGQHETAVLALIARIGVTRTVLADYDEADRIARQTRAKLAFRDLGEDVRARLEHEVGSLRRRQGRHEEALEALERVLEIRERIDGPDHPRTADALKAVGDVLYKRRDFAGARDYTLRAMEAWKRANGPSHPSLATGEQRLGYVAWRRGRYDEALERQQRAYEIELRARGPEHPGTLSKLVSIGSVLATMLRHDEAHEALTSAVAAYDRVYGPTHPTTAMARSDLGTALLIAGRYEEARETLTRALDQLSVSHEPDHPSMAYILRDLGRVSRRMGRPEEGITLLRRAVEVWTKELGPSHPKNAWALQHLGECELDLGRLEDAARTLERALEIHDPGVSDPLHLADMRFGLARALARRDAARATSLAMQARDTYAASAYRETELVRVQRWLERQKDQVEDG